MQPEVIVSMCCCSAVLFVTCAAVVLFILLKKDPYNQDPPKMPGVQGDATALATPAVVQQVLRAALTQTSQTLQATIRKTGARGVRTYDFMLAMKAYNKKQAQQILTNITNMGKILQDSDVGALAFVSQAVLYSVNNPGAAGKKTVETPDTDLQCPSGWKRCNDPNFNSYNPNMNTLLDKMLSTDATKVTKSSRRFCCKFGNASNDPRPETQEKLKDNLNFVSRFFTTLDIAFSIISIALPVGKIFEVVSSATSVVGSMPIAGINGNEVHVAFNDNDPWMGCQEPPGRSQYFKNNPKGIYQASFNDKDGKPTSAFYTSDNCPLSVLPVEVAMYGVQLKNAMLKVQRDEYDPIKFEEFNPRGRPIWCDPLADKKPRCSQAEPNKLQECRLTKTSIRGSDPCAHLRPDKKPPKCAVMGRGGMCFQYET